MNKTSIHIYISSILKIKLTLSLIIIIIGNDYRSHLRRGKQSEWFKSKVT